MWKKTTSWLLLAAASLAAASVVPHHLDASASPSLPSAPKTAEFDLEITWAEYAPLGVPRKVLLVNGQTPGPELRFDQDDAVTVRVVNNSPFNTTLHFHGLEMHGTPWSDGVPGVTQRHIRPGRSFTYRFAATQHGSYWYHSHARDQIEDGLYGAVFIRPRPGTPHPFHLIDPAAAASRAMERAAHTARTLAVFDLLRVTSEEKWAVTLASGIEIPCYEKLVFNGKGRARCLPAELMSANLTPVQKADLALIPGSSLTDRG
ncbi:laccase [Cordyceps fumosorosea ARSEF 2679]|uniref:Laccase n=1 Tax=Cordyceps fumosorosea (strain ARSEF 2679) TaxID=1081104 RepID=A0A167YG24_CORFA|nr:laccase [Cordyceps fumosorosea ARSEF 2679]OAA66283.1 laccase [Cordyceps fumosorosea ARSEF 2679]